MGLSDFLGNIGVGLAGQPRRARTPPFLPPGAPIGPTPAAPPNVPPPAALPDPNDQTPGDDESYDYTQPPRMSPVMQAGGGIGQVRPGQPKYQSADDRLQETLEHPPERKKTGIWRQLGGGILMNMGGAIGSTLGSKLAYGDYPEKLAEWQANVGNQTLAAKQRLATQEEARKIEQNQNQTAESKARREDLAKTREATDKDRDATRQLNEQKEGYGLLSSGAGKLYEAPKPGSLPYPMPGAPNATVPVVPPKPANVRTIGGMDIQVGQKPQEFKTIEERLLAVMDDRSLLPEQAKQKQDQLVRAHNLLHPTAPIHGIETDAGGNSTLIVADPQNPAGAQKIPLGRIGKPQQAPGASAPYSPQEVRKNDEQLAQGLVNGDLMSLKDFSIRSGERSMVIGRAKELAAAQGKRFDVSSIKRKLDQMDYISNGKGADAIQSFDTFVQHAAGAIDAAKELNRTNPRLLNKPVSWWRENMQDDPAFAAYLTALEPAPKEFESFLLNGKALYTDDRTTIQRLVNENQPLKAQIATFRQMGITAKDRYTSINQRHKNIMGTDLAAPWSPAAVDSARKLGIALREEGEGGEKGVGVNGSTGGGAGAVAGLPSVKTQEQFNALPSGAKYIGKDGNTYQKP